MQTRPVHFAVLTLVALSVAACGQKKGFDKGDGLEPAVLGGGGGGRVQSAVQVSTVPGSSNKILVKKTVRRPKAQPTYNIVSVTQIVTATSGIPNWTTSDLPLTSAKSPNLIGETATDDQTPFSFAYDWPANNYQFTEASLVIDTSRDDSGTEGIFVDGVFTGNPPLASVNMSTDKTLYRLYTGNGGATTNTYYMDFSLAHYKVNTRNTFTLAMPDLLQGSSLAPLDVLKDGALNVVTGDDSPVYQAYLVVNGLTTSSDELTCSNSDTFTFTNVYVHNDGNTVGQAAFKDTPVGTPYTSWNAVGAYPSFEFNFDAPLPKVAVDNITIDTASISLKAKKVGTDGAAIVINGIGVAGTGFDKSKATSVVESWDDTASAAFNTFMDTDVTTNSAGATATLDLVALFGGGDTGKAKVRSLLAQGKLNVAVAGNLYAYGQAATSTRVGATVDGPELNLSGTYYTQICNVPNNPDSPLTQDGVVDPPVEYEDVVVEEWVDADSADTSDTVVVTNDGAGPVIGSLQALQITSNSATIVWSTDEGATSQVAYGIGSPTSLTAEDTNLSTFHQVHLTGLSPYKYYDFQVITKDRYGNLSKSPITVLTTLR